MISRYILFLLLGIDAFILFFQTSELSISSFEANILYGEASLLQIIIKTSLYIFGNNDFALRLPMIVFHFLSVFLLYFISFKYLKHEKDRLWLLLVFILLPGIVSSALQVNMAGILIFALFLFVYIYEKFGLKPIYIFMVGYSFIDGSFLYLALSMIFFSYHIKDKILFIVSLFSMVISLYIYGINAHGLPSGHLLDAFGVYFAIFSPIVFIYIFYILYKKFYTKDIDILWFMSFIPLVFSLLLSLRQRVELDEFAPYIMLALPLSAKVFSEAYRVRLKIFRKNYKLIFVISLVFLFFNYFVVVFNKELYKVIQHPKKHFAYKMYIAKELAQRLKELNIDCIDTYDSLSNRLDFYGIKKCNKFSLNEIALDDNDEANVTISYKSVDVYKATVTKVNNK